MPARAICSFNASLTRFSYCENACTTYHCLLMASPSPAQKQLDEVTYYGITNPEKRRSKQSNDDDDQRRLHGGLAVGPYHLAQLHPGALDVGPRHPAHRGLKPDGHRNTAPDEHTQYAHHVADLTLHVIKTEQT